MAAAGRIGCVACGIIAPRTLARLFASPSNWISLTLAGARDYTWTGRRVERQLDAAGNVKSEKKRILGNHYSVRRTAPQVHGAE